MYLKRCLYSFLLLCLPVLKSDAQGQFVEGILTYSVVIEPPANQEGVQQYHGTYTIMIKGKQLCKDLAMENGFHNTILYTDGQLYILREAGGKKFAVAMDKETYDKQNDVYENFELKKKKATKTIAGIEGQKGTVIYKDGRTVDIYFSPDWQPDEMIFEKFPGIEVLPLTYEHKSDDGMVMFFQLEKIEQKPLENTVFHIPQDYKIMTHKEYEQMNR